MLRYAAISLIVALIAFIFGFVAVGLVAGIVWIAKIVCVVALIGFAVLFIIHMLNRRKKNAPKSAP